MKKTVIASLLLGAASAGAQEPAAPKSDAKQPRIAVIDMQRVSSESLLGKSYAAQLEGLRNEINSEQTKKQADLQKLDAAIKALQEELEKQGSVLSEEAKEKKRQEIVKKTRERQAFLEDGQAELQRMNERAQQQAQSLNGEFQTKIKPIIEAVAKDKGIDIIIDNQAALVMNRDFDISRDVIVKADDMEKSAKASGAAKPAAPAARPAPAASPTPAPSPKP
jgi:outer membrane protein